MRQSKKYRYPVFIFLGVCLALSGCGSDEVKLAKLENGSSRLIIRIKDVKDDLYQNLRWHREITNDMDWHKNFLFSSFLSKEIAYLEELDKGLTNTQGFKPSYMALSQKKHLHNLATKGEKVLTKMMEASKVETARVSVIFLQNITPKTGDTAIGMLLAIQDSGNAYQEFRKLAALMSDDKVSAKRNGDLGYITETMLDKTLSDAIFKVKTKGILLQPVYTGKGCFLVYVTEPAEPRTIKELSKLMGSEKYRLVTFSFADKWKNANQKVFYSFNNLDNTITIHEKAYSPGSIPDKAELFTVFDKTYNWEESKQLLENFSPETDIQKDLRETLKNLIDLAFNLEAAKKAGLDQPVKEDYSDTEIIKEIALENTRLALLQEFKNTIQPGISREVLMAYYETNKQQAVKDVNGRKVQLTFSQLEKEIYDVVNEEAWNNFTRSWNAKMKQKYRVTYYDQGLRRMQKLEMAFVNRHMPAKGNNLTLRSPVEDSSRMKSSQQNAYAVDGIDDTVWYSATNAGPQWLSADMGSKKSIRQVILKWGEIFPKSFLVEVSANGSDWQTAYHVKECSGGINEVRLDKTEARYVRVYSSDRSGFSLKELEVYR